MGAHPNLSRLPHMPRKPAARSTSAAAPPTLHPGDITRVRGIEVGHFTDTRRPTGCSVVIARAGAVGGVDVRGAAPGTRETDLLDPANLVGVVHAVLLAGGSAWGLDAAGGVMRWLEDEGVGLYVGSALTAISAPTVTPATVTDAVPRPPFMACCMPNILPTTAPLPAPTLPSAGGALLAAWQAA